MRFENTSLPNITIPFAVEQKILEQMPGATVAMIHPALLPVVTAVATKMLGVWELRGGRRDLGTMPIFTGFYVYDEDVKLGSVWLNNEYKLRRGNVDVFYVESPRISGRRGHVNTMDAKAAVRNVMKHMKLPTDVETMAAQTNRSCEVYAEVVRSAESGVNIAMWRSEHTKFLPNFVVEHVETYRAYVNAHSPTTDLTALDTLPDKVQELDVVRSVDDADIVVFERGGQWLYRSMTDTQYPLTVVSPDDAPDWMRRKVTMLKLVEPTQVIRGVGLRVEENVFRVTKD